MIGEYEVEVRVHSYLNPTGRCDECREDNNPDPGCCDESTIRPIDETCPVVRCDTTMIICSRPVNSTVEVTGVNCPGLNNMTGSELYFNTISREFSLGPLNFFGLANPLELSSPGAWVVSALLIIQLSCQYYDCI